MYLRADLLGRKGPSCMFYLGAALRAAPHLQLGGCLVRLSLLQGHNLQILEIHLTWSGLMSPCWQESLRGPNLLSNLQEFT